MALPPSSGPQAAGPATNIAVQAQVLRKAAITALRAPEQVMLTAVDIARGYIDIARPVEVEFRTNDPNGAVLGLGSTNAAVRAVAVLGHNLGPGGDRGATMIRIPKAAPGHTAHSVALRVRIELVNGAQPGLLAWPVFVFLAPG